ncbi:MAG: hypothetical protein AAF742_08525 [Pseudomonadota bacterium]
MSDNQSGSAIDISTDSGSPGNANLVYILFLVSLALGVTALVGIVFAYLGKDKADPMVRSHYINQIHIFWRLLAFAIVGVILTPFLIGPLILLVAAVWYVIRVIKGIQSLSRREEIGNPNTWGI